MNEDVHNQFTAIGSIYLIKKEFSNKLKIFNFESKKFEEMDSNSISFKTHSFHHAFKLRKGYMKTVFELMGNLFQFYNCHLYSDKSNLKASQDVPSPFSIDRRNQLETIFNHSTELSSNSFYFGDFNFR